MQFLPRVMRPVVSLTLGKALADHADQEALVTGSGLPWTIVRPGQLTEKPAGDRAVARLEPGNFVAMIARADLARLMVDLLEDADAEGHAYALGTAG
jgi:kynurenine 3-monooxygenase